MTRQLAVTSRGLLLSLAMVWASSAASLGAGDRPGRPPSPALPSGPMRKPAELRGEVIVVLGAEGTPDYGVMFADWAELWEAAADRGNYRFQLVGDLVGDASSAVVKQQVQQALETAATADPVRPLWIVLIGHGTFDSRAAKFNLVGDDLTAEEFAEWLQPCRRPLAVMQCAATSAPFLDLLSGEGRVIISATKSGQEQNFARFGGYLAASLADPAADFDKDEQVSLLETFLRASRLTEEYYSGDNRLATEHALLDDNGDQRGTRATAFEGVRPVREADSGATLDGYLAHQWQLIPSEHAVSLPPEQEQRRRELEVAVLRLRERKGDLTADEYYAQLEHLLVELARISLGRGK